MLDSKTDSLVARGKPRDETTIASRERGLDVSTWKDISALTPFSLILGCALLIAQPNLVGAASPTVTAIGYEVFGLEAYMAWIDNDRFLFAGSKSIGLDAPRTSFEPSKLYLWNDTTKSVQMHADATSFCYTPGRISYTAQADREEGKKVFRAGPFGAEKEIERLRPVQGIFSRFTCQTHSVSELVPPAPGRRILILREGDGYIDLGPYGSRRLEHPRNLTLFQTKTGKAIQLPMTWDEDIGGVGTSYSTYRGAYVLPPRLLPSSGVSGHWPPKQPRVVYLLWADGKVERVSIPPTPHMNRPHPVSIGWVYGGGDQQTAGLYLYVGKKVSRVAVGGVKEIKVSLDGCKAAVAIRNRYKDMGTPNNLKIFNFCGGEK